MDKGALIALAVAAFAAGIALAGFLRPPVAPQVVLPAATEPQAPTGMPGAPSEPAMSLAEIQEELAAITQLVKEIAEAYGDLRRRVEALEKRGD